MSLYDFAAYRLAAEFCRPRPRVEQPTPGRVIDLHRAAYGLALRRIKSDLRQWHEDFDRALREGL